MKTREQHPWQNILLRVYLFVFHLPFYQGFQTCSIFSGMWLHCCTVGLPSQLGRCPPSFLTEPQFHAVSSSLARPLGFWVGWDHRQVTEVGSWCNKANPNDPAPLAGSRLSLIWPWPVRNKLKEPAGGLWEKFIFLLTFLCFHGIYIAVAAIW